VNKRTIGYKAFSKDHTYVAHMRAFKQKRRPPQGERLLPKGCVGTRSLSEYPCAIGLGLRLHEYPSVIELGLRLHEYPSAIGLDLRLHEYPSAIGLGLRLREYPSAIGLGLRLLEFPSEIWLHWRQVTRLRP
jgi:hypothetical protein